MKSLFISAVLVLLLSLCVCSDKNDKNEKRNFVDVSKLDYHILSSLLKSLRTLGKEQKPPLPTTNKKVQYTCTLVVSEDELEQEANDWIKNKSLPGNFKENNRRVRTQYNSEVGDVSQHGEKILLEKYLDGLIDNMQNDSRRKNYNVYPIVIMFSYFIPCSLTNHKCAEL